MKEKSINNNNTYNKSVTDDVLSNKDISDLKMGIYVKKRNIHMSNNLDMGMNYSMNSMNKIILCSYW